jgi:signal transduction histidine kinase
MDGDGFALDGKPLDVAVLAAQAVESLRPDGEARGVGLELRSSGPLPLEGDPVRLTQVLYNLIGNALKFTPAGGHVQVVTGLDGTQAQVAVRDTGSGMLPDQLSRLFKPFSQVHEAGALTRAMDKGTGLGLYISKGIVEAHGGSITAASGGPGQGSTFTFRLPLAGPADGPV